MGSKLDRDRHPGEGLSGPRNSIAICRSAAAVALLGAAAPVAAPDQGPPFTLQQVAPGVYAAIDRDARAGANAGFVIGDDGVVLVDSFQYPEVAESLLTEIHKLTPLPVRYVINTHYHIDHVAGSGVFKRAGALVVAQRNVLAWIRTENLKFLGADQTKERALVAGLPLPDNPARRPPPRAAGPARTYRRRPGRRRARRQGALLWRSFLAAGGAQSDRRDGLEMD